MENSSSHLDHEGCIQNSAFVVSVPAVISVVTLSTLSAIAAIFLNVLVIWAIYRNPTLRSVTNYWIISLAIADLLIAILGVPVWCLKLLQKADLIRPNVHNLFTVVVVLTLGSSSLNLLALSYDRFVGVTSPFQYHSRITSAKCGKVIAAIWIASVLAALVSLLNKCTITAYGHFLLFAVIFGIPLIFISYFYFRIFKEAKRQKRLIKVQKANSLRDQPGFLKENKAAMTVAMVTGSFALCWLPSLVDSMIHLFAPIFWEKTQLWLGTTTLACFSPVLNPILYSVRIKAFRNTFRTLIVFTRLKRNSVSVIFRHF